MPADSPGSGPRSVCLARGAVTTLNTLAELKLSSVPQGEGLDWSVGKVTFGHPQPTESESSQDNAMLRRDPRLIRRTPA
jgi:hypothetical protein